MKTLLKISIFCLVLAHRSEALDSVSKQLGWVGDLNYSPSCSQKLIHPDALGDLRNYVGKGVASFKDDLRDEKGNITGEVEYQVEIGKVASQDSDFQKIVQGLKTRANANGIEQEVGAFSFAIPASERRKTVYYSSRLSERILARNNRQALNRIIDSFFNQVEETLEKASVIPDGVEIWKLHIHPSFVNVPQSPQDIYQDIRFRKWMRESPVLRQVGYRSFVIPLFYSGEIFAEFDPSRHRVF